MWRVRFYFLLKYHEINFIISYSRNITYYELFSCTNIKNFFWSDCEDHDGCRTDFFHGNPLSGLLKNCGNFRKKYGLGRNAINVNSIFSRLLLSNAILLPPFSRVSPLMFTVSFNVMGRCESQNDSQSLVHRISSVRNAVLQFHKTSVYNLKLN